MAHAWPPSCLHSPDAPPRRNPKHWPTGNRILPLLARTKVHYVTVGGGRQTIVFVHCWAGNLGFWREQVPAFANQARLVLIDLPGHGQSDKPHTAYTMDFFASAVLAVMRDAHVDKATLVGHSMGGAVICCVYRQAPEKVAALVSVDGLLRRPQWTPGQAGKFVAPFRTPEYREQVKQFVGSFFPDSRHRSVARPGVVRNARHAAIRDGRRDGGNVRPGPARLGLEDRERARARHQCPEPDVERRLRKLRPLALAADGLPS